MNSSTSNGSLTVTTFSGSKIFGFGSFRNASMSNGSRHDRVLLTCSTSTVVHPSCLSNRPLPRTSTYSVASRRMSSPSAGSKRSATYPPPSSCNCAVPVAQFTSRRQPNKIASSGLEWELSASSSGVHLWMSRPSSVGVMSTSASSLKPKRSRSGLGMVIRPRWEMRMSTPG